MARARSCVVSLRSDFTQKCHVSPEILTSINAKIGDYVVVQCQSILVVCKLYIQRSPVRYITADDTVSRNLKGDGISSGFKCLPVIFLRKIHVQVCMKDIKSLVKLRGISELKFWIKRILCQYSVIRGCCVRCSGHSAGDSCGISKIEILDICESENTIGRIIDSTVLEVNEIVIDTHLKQLTDLQDIKIGGLDSVLSCLNNFLNMRTKENCSYFSNILLTGPPGCGKSTIIKKIVAETKSYLHIIRVQEVVRKDFSNFVNLLVNIVQMERLNLKLRFVFMFEDLDYLCTGASKEKSKALYLVTSLLDLMTQCQNIVVFGLASSLRHVHPLLRKPGRFTKEIYIGVPTLEQRHHILETLTANMKCVADLSEIARTTPGFVGSDLSLLCFEAERNAHDCADSTEKKVISEEMQVTTKDFEKALTVVKPSLLKDSAFRINVQPVHWNDIGGMDAIKKRVQLCVEWPLLHPEAFSSVGLPCPHGVLLFGPPGCCKTTLVRVLATECKVTLLSANPAQIYSPFVGDSEKSIIELFHQARLCAPSVIFLDEIDSLVGKRSYSSANRGIQEKVLSALLNEMDGCGIRMESLQGHRDEKTLENEEIKSQNVSFESKVNQNVIVVAATNRIDLIDDALLRPGRFDSIVYVPPPNVQERVAILQTLTKKMSPQGINLDFMAEQTELFSGADLKNLCRMAALSAIKSSSQVTEKHFISALKIACPSITKKQLLEYERLASKYGPVIGT